MDVDEEQENRDKFNEDDLFTQETYDKIMRDKRGEPSKYQSYWEYDEDDIEKWSQKEILEDPGKQLLINAENGNLDEVKKILNQNKEYISYKDQDGYSALHRAAYSNNLNICKYLLNLDKNIIECKTDMGWTALHSASYWNNYEIVDYLINSVGANINALTNSKQTALHLAASQRNCKETIILFLLNKFINYNLLNENNESAADIATRSCECYRLFEITDLNLNQINY